MPPALGALTIIWVCPDFCREHIAAVKWLNEVTEDRSRFFAVKFELLQISALQGPRFTVVLGPDDRERMPRPKRDVTPKITESAKRRREYWQEFLDALRLLDTVMRVPAPNTLGNLRFNLQGRDLWIPVYAASSLGRMGVFLRGKPEYKLKMWLKRKQIESKIAAPLYWNETDNHWNIAISRKADPSERQDWPRQHRWLSLRLNEFISAFRPL